MAVLAWLGAAALTVLGLAFLVGGGVLGAWLGSEEAFLGWLLPLVGGALGLLFLGWAALEGIIGWGLWAGKGWAWILMLVLEGLWGLGAAVGVATGDIGSIVSVAIAGAIIWYLFRPWVKRYFGQ